MNYLYVNYIIECNVMKANFASKLKIMEEDSTALAMVKYKYWPLYKPVFFYL